MNRAQLDDYANKILENNDNVLLAWPTGCGKTKQAIKAIRMLNNNEHNDILIVVAEIPHKKNWIEEFYKWDAALLTDINYTINIICYNSLKKVKEETFDLIIFDEVHHLFTDKRIADVKKINTMKTVCLSATVDDEHIDMLNHLFGDTFVSKISFQQAISWKLIPIPKIILVPMVLDNNILDQLIVFKRGKSSKRVKVRCTTKDKFKYLSDKKKYPNIELTMSCTQLQKYNEINTQIEKLRKLYKAKKSEYVYNKWQQLCLTRKKYLGLLKNDKAKEILSIIKNNRFICFCTNVEQANYLGGDRSINFKNKDSLKTIDAFNEKKINSLFVVGMLKEGQNLTDIEKGLIIQLDGKERPFIQKSGRVLRAENPEIYILYFKGTQDEVYLNRVLEGLNPDYIQYYENHY